MCSLHVLACSGRAIPQTMYRHSAAFALYRLVMQLLTVCAWCVCVSVHVRVRVCGVCVCVCVCVELVT